MPTINVEFLPAELADIVNVLGSLQTAVGAYPLYAKLKFILDNAAAQQQVEAQPEGDENAHTA
jgi:hypothetical protein